MKKYLTIILIVSLFGCETPSNCRDYYFSDDFSSYVYSNSGSYWIYYDSLLGVTDSVNLIRQTISFDDNCTYSTQPHEKLIDTVYSSYFEGDNEHIWIGRGEARDNYYYQGYLTGSYDNNGTYIDSMYVQGVWYMDVLEFKTNNNDKYYRAKNIGLVKREFSILSTNEFYSFELIKYHIE